MQHQFSLIQPDFAQQKVELHVTSQSYVLLVWASVIHWWRKTKQNVALQYILVARANYQPGQRRANPRGIDARERAPSITYDFFQHKMKKGRTRVITMNSHVQCCNVVFLDNDFLPQGQTCSTYGLPPRMRFFGAQSYVSCGGKGSAPFLLRGPCFVCQFSFYHDWPEAGLLNSKRHI